MSLFVRDLGGSGRPPLVVLHGFLGSSRNWIGTGKRLAETFHVRALDLPNHGSSPRLEPATYDRMVAALLDTLDELGLDRVHLMGHSLGGKLVMRTACDHPRRVEHLYVLDIAPRLYPFDPRALDAMAAVDLASVQQRSDAEAQMAEHVSSKAHRLFLLTNLVRTDAGDYRWQVDLDLLRTQLPIWLQPPLTSGQRFDGPTTVITGSTSKYIVEGDAGLTQGYFPSARFHQLEGSGHNVHIEGGEAFLSAVLSV